MSSGMPGIGSLRFLGITLGLNDQFSAGMVRATRHANAFKVAAGGAAGGVGLLRGQLAMLGMGSAMVFGAAARQAAMFEREVTLAAFATSRGASAFDDISASSRRLGQELNQSPVAMARLNKEIAQMGDLSRDAADGLGNAAVRLSMVTSGELTSEQAAKIIFRLGLVTKKSGETMEDQVGHALRYASAIKVAGDESAAGAGAVTLMLGTLNALGQVANVTEAQLITLSSVLTNVHETSREKFTTSLMRIFGKEFLDPDMKGPISQLMDISADEFDAMRRNNPFEMMLAFITAVAEAATSQGKDKLEVLHALGFDNIRDDQTISALLANLDRIKDSEAGMGIYTQISRELGEVALENLNILETTNTILGQAQGVWDGFTSSVQAAGLGIGNVVQMALMPLLATLGPIITMLSSPIVAGGAAGVGAFFAGAAGLRLMSGIRRAKGGATISQGFRHGRGPGVFGGGMIPASVQAFVLGKSGRGKMDPAILKARGLYNKKDYGGAASHLRKSGFDGLAEELDFLEMSDLGDDSFFNALGQMPEHRQGLFKDFMSINPDDPHGGLAPTMAEAVLMMAAMSGGLLRKPFAFMRHPIKGAKWRGKKIGKFFGGFRARGNMGADAMQAGYLDSFLRPGRAHAQMKGTSWMRGAGRMMGWAGMPGMAGGFGAALGTSGSSLGMRAATFGVPVVGWIGAMAAAQPALKSFADTLNEVGREKGGVMGGLIRTFGILTKSIELLINAVLLAPRFIFRKTIDAYNATIGQIPGIKQVHFDSAFNNLDDWNAKLYEMGTGKKYRTDSGATKVVNNNTTVNATIGGGDSLNDLLNRGAQSSNFLTFQSSTPNAGLL